MDIDKLTSIDQLRDDQKELAEVIGLEAYKRLIKHYGGNPLYIQKVDSVLKDIRDQEINEKFDGGNYKELAREYGICELTIRDIVAPKRRELKNVPLEGQLRFDEI
ncbi:MAG: DNA-binding protein [Ruminococcus flavefaciens]|nr:DNA-binding protein [Ruminococcus flavefaciens]MCM1363177.1 DNA-binding protein [Clostridiales bacterium]MCM1436221.1 DNA-binding protein [Ruminococcus flavefaciens]